jgi:hypothetical protein
MLKAPVFHFPQACAAQPISSEYLIISMDSNAIDILTPARRHFFRAMHGKPYIKRQNRSDAQRHFLPPRVDKYRALAVKKP